MPRLSVVVLTLNEARNIGLCLAALAAQRNLDFEVILVDAASTDDTVKIVRALQPSLPFAMRILASDQRLPIGAARNLGVATAETPYVAFLSADAELDLQWTSQALASLQSYEMVFGMQVHAPHKWTLGASVRGLRYHFPADSTDDPFRYASNVAAAYHREILTADPFDAWANAAEDLLFARRAAAKGARIVYNPGMVVRHSDVATTRQEFRKNVREGQGCGEYVAELGVQWPVLAWGTATAVATAWAVARPHPATALLLAAVLFAPALRRGLRRFRAMPTRWLALGIAATPAFDLAFFVCYLWGLMARRRPKPGATSGIDRQDAPPMHGGANDP